MREIDPGGPPRDHAALAVKNEAGDPGYAGAGHGEVGAAVENDSRRIERRTGVRPFGVLTEKRVDPPAMLLECRRGQRYSRGDELLAHRFAPVFELGRVERPLLSHIEAVL